MTPPPPPPAEEQPDLLPGLAGVRAAKARATRARKAVEVTPAPTQPVARVLLDLQPAHLDRVFDFAVPATLADAARPGVRVKVRFAGQEADGFLLERADESDHTGLLQPLRRVVGSEAVLTPEIAALAGDVAARYAGTRPDVLRLAVPPRHATAEAEEAARRAASPVQPRPPAGPGPAETAWAAHPHAAAWLGHLRAGGAPRAVWNPPPGADWPLLLAHAALAAPGGVVVCVPDGKDVARVDAALTSLAPPGAPQHAVLTADLGPAARYRSFLRLLHGEARIAVGTRAAAFAPVPDLALVVVWDDGDDLLSEPRAPYPHARETLLLRAGRAGAAALVGGFARTVEADHLLRTGWAHELTAARETVRAAARIEVAGASEMDLVKDPHARTSRLPQQALQLLREGLESGPVLVLNPRQGYVASLACERCRTPARCPACTGPLRLTGPTTPPGCAWCGTEQPTWSCPECGDHGLRAPVLGQARTAEEIGRALPRARVRTSARDHVLTTVDTRPQVVVATPGAEPVAEGGYAAVVLLDAWVLLSRPDLRTEEEALRRWANAAGLVRPGGRVLLVADPAHAASQALVRWDMGGFVAREAASRAEAHLPPASRLAIVEGTAGALDDVLVLLDPPEAAEVLGPVPVDPSDPESGHRVVVRVPRAQGAALSAALGEVQRVRAARKLEPVRLQVDPYSL
ncbi:primosome assembly protein PriA [Nocardioides sp. GY 10127]|uniref:primosomal protein N' family DNA-binding protein n=1 Tax=Nocardioides sp. GY 10127 TaxID=2569762 RepID=UPI0010A76F2C|nr:primosome assembly protein PriA [Nocardioides sp. GY 10127]TIC85451.1 primosome assembly protein PriA [Nocardioides sp. GY 10127]